MQDGEVVGIAWVGQCRGDMVGVHEGAYQDIWWRFLGSGRGLVPPGTDAACGALAAYYREVRFADEGRWPPRGQLF